MTMDGNTGPIGVAEADELPLHKFLTYRLARLQSGLTAQGTRLLSRVSDLSLNQWRILSLVGTYPGKTASDICRISHIDKGLLSRKLKSMVQNDLITATVDPNDHRAVRLTLTAQGEEVRTRILPVMQDRQRRLNAALTEDELESAFRIVEKIEAMLEQED